MTIVGDLPPGTVALGRRWLRSVRDLGVDVDVDDTAAAVERHLTLPLSLVEDWPPPSEPLPVGDGAVHADLIDEDHEALARLREAWEGPLDAESLAAEAQRWRLPVTPYRRRGSQAGVGSVVDGGLLPPATRPVAGRALDQALVVDLSALWAGPLATSLLAAAGARVVKVDPSARPDAFAEHAVLYAELNGAKEIIDLDLRVDGDRGRFEALVAEADLVVDSFSRRVLPNLGYGVDSLRRLQPGVSTLSIRAFGRGTPEQDWVSYGPGVHAMSGLAVGSDGRFRAAPIAYPDALAGLAAFASAVDQLAAGTPTDREVSLAGVIAPLAAGKGCDR